MFSSHSSASGPSANTRAPRAAAVVIAGGLIIGGVSACASPSHPADAAAPAGVAPAANLTTLSYIATDIDGDNVFVDLGDKSDQGPDIGDLLAFTQNLSSDGENVGQVHVAAVVVDHDTHVSEATGTIVLADGSIQVAGVVTQDPKFTLTVTGGTGAYLGATGTMSFDASGSDQTITLELK